MTAITIGSNLVLGEPEAEARTAGMRAAMNRLVC